jgi:hypothetical protein
VTAGVTRAGRLEILGIVVMIGYRGLRAGVASHVGRPKE